jgi:hypothetical protein
MRDASTSGGGECLTSKEDNPFVSVDECDLTFVDEDFWEIGFTAETILVTASAFFGSDSDAGMGMNSLLCKELLLAPSR